MASKSLPTLESYQILAPLGAGGLSTVYKARPKKGGGLCAIKIAHIPDELDDEERAKIIERFENEMKLIRELDDPHIVKLLDVGTTDGVPFMVLEYIDGRTLASLLEEGPLSQQLSRSIVEQVAEAVAEAHKKGIVHRDLKPANIMITTEGDEPLARVLDFGVAQLAGEGPKDEESIGEPIWGTPSYMAPELVRSPRGASVKSDVYAIGLVLLECLTGEPGFTGDSPKEICNKQLFRPLRIPDKWEDTSLGLIVERACQKNPSHRFPNASELCAAFGDEAETRQQVLAMREAKKNVEGPATVDVAAAGAELAGAVMMEVPDVPPPPPLPTVEEAAEPTPPPTPLKDVTAERRRRRFLLFLAFILVLVIIGFGLAIGYKLSKRSAQPADSQEAPVADTAPVTPDVVEPPPVVEETTPPSPADIVEAPPTEPIELEADRVRRLLAEARAAREIDDATGALALYEQVLELDPDSHEALEGAGWGLLNLNRFKDAVTVFVKAIEAGLENDNILLGLAIAYEGTEQLQEAVETYKRFLQVYPENKHVEDVELQVQRIKKDIRRAKRHEKRKKETKRPPIFK